MEQDYMKNFLPYDDEENDPIIDNLKNKLEGVTELHSSKHASKAPSRFAKESDEAFDVEFTYSEDIGSNLVTNDDRGHVGVGTSRDRAESVGAKLEQERLKQHVDSIEEFLNTLVAYVEGGKFRRSEKAKKKENEMTLKEKVQAPAQKFDNIRSPAVEVDVPRPVVEVENVDVHYFPMPTAQVEKAVEVIVPAAPDEKTTDFLAQVNGKIISAEVEVDSEKVVTGVITQINASLDI
ncbi:hypothetical protein K7X08_000206 [Anisodus acutangulus]|uniref:Uncharacterized protein n=1 Tax=Anisodus acutangulus TaxID=402998 RepID=A0A9Q1M3D7_9SOLA|nr:hypothetical protein K7X08_000206 [Anisodus acutangulus]